MKRTLLIGLLMAALVLPMIAQNYDDAGMDFSKALAENKTCGDRVKALQAYIKKYTDTSNLFVRLAYFNLATNYFNCNNYANAVKYADTRIKMGEFGEGEEVRLYLVMANSYAITSSPVYNQGSALKFAKDALRVAKATRDFPAQKAANDMIKKLSGPPPKKMTPEQEIKMKYSEEDYLGAISFYNKLGAGDKENTEIHMVYCNALFKAKRYDTALKEFKALYEKDQKAKHAKKIADIYAAKAKRNKQFYDQAANYYLEASVLYQKEKSFSNQRVAKKKATSQLGDKYGYNQKVERINREVQQSKNAAAQNKQQLRKAERDLEREQMKQRRKYDDMGLTPPQYELDKIKNLQKRIKQLKSGASSDVVKKIAALEGERKKIDAEIAAKLKEITARLNK
jgi:tetratricopeptide (TPR) repeat protein